MGPTLPLRVNARGCLGVVLCVYALSYASAAAPSSDEMSFMAENNAAMSTMMKNMDVKPSGNVDEDFVAMMQPHHQAAIEMAQAELRYGHNERVRKIAQQIIVQQQQEITAMRDAVGPSTLSPGSADQPEQGHWEVPHKNPKMDGPPGS